LTHLSDPVLEGDTAGLLSLTFDHPAYRLSFGLALISFATVDLAALVSFYDGSGNLLDFGPVATEPLVDWTEGLYVGPPDNYFHSVVIEFNSAEASRFALDNLSYRLVGVPDSGTWWGGAIGAAFLGLAGMRRLTCGSR
jgi:hypothetical protein